MREKGQNEVAKTLGTPVFSRGIEILTEKKEFLPCVVCFWERAELLDCHSGFQTILLEVHS